MSFFSDVVEYLKTTIEETVDVTPFDDITDENVDDIFGRIYDSVVHITTEKELREKILLNYSTVGKDKKKFRAWMITRTGFSPDESGGSLFFRDHTFELYPYYAYYGDESEMVFQNHIERVANLFDSDIYLGCHVLTSRPMTATQIGHRTWLNTLCHSAQLTFTAREERSY